MPFGIPGDNKKMAHNPGPIFLRAGSIRNKEGGGIRKNERSGWLQNEILSSFFSIDGAPPVFVRLALFFPLAEGKPACWRHVRRGCAIYPNRDRSSIMGTIANRAKDRK